MLMQITYKMAQYGYCSKPCTKMSLINIPKVAVHDLSMAHLIILQKTVQPYCHYSVQILNQVALSGH